MKDKIKVSAGQTPISLKKPIHNNMCMNEGILKEMIWSVIYFNDKLHPFM